MVLDHQEHEFAMSDMICHMGGRANKGNVFSKQDADS
jgi:hypothetical protein